jgi:hypothetical protein
VAGQTTGPGDKKHRQLKAYSWPFKTVLNERMNDTSSSVLVHWIPRRLQTTSWTRLGGCPLITVTAAEKKGRCVRPFSGPKLLSTSGNSSCFSIQIDRSPLPVTESARTPGASQLSPLKLQAAYPLLRKVMVCVKWFSCFGAEDERLPRLSTGPAYTLNYRSGTNVSTGSGCWDSARIHHEG